MPLDWSDLNTAISRFHRFLLTCHIRPDGDSLGSMLALGETLERRGKSVQYTVASKFPSRYAFMDPERRVNNFAIAPTEIKPADAIIVLDTGAWNQLGDFGPFLRQQSAERFVVDHHLTQDDLGATRFVDSDAEATGRLVYEILTSLGESLSPRVAELLFVALAMDTGWFRHSNTKPRTMTLAGELIAAGAQPAMLYEQLFEQNTLARQRLTGLVLERMEVAHDGKTAHTEIRQGDYAATGAVPQDSEDLVDYTKKVAGVEVGVFFMEQPRGGVKVSLRSRSQVDVARLAELFNGGGHRLAAGAIVDASLAEAKERVLCAVAEALKR